MLGFQVLLSVLEPKDLLRNNICPNIDCGNLPPSPTERLTETSRPKPHASTYRTYILRLGEVLSDDLSGLRRDPVWEVDGKLHDEVAAL